MVDSLRTDSPISIDASSVKLTRPQSRPRLFFVPWHLFAQLTMLAPLHPLVEAFIVGRLSGGGRADVILLNKNVPRLARTVLDVFDELTAVAGAQCRRSAGSR